MAGLRIDSQQNGSIPLLGLLQRSGELEGMARHYPVIALGCDDKGGRILSLLHIVQGRIAVQKLKVLWFPGSPYSESSSVPP